ncbi:hypothetical protein [Microtetraspora glauca]|uniref:Uncharacterized protein n=1 Tax=Microtetraspora glauca TaxID=1996 RepID=A0ABV3GAC5_MICGL
MRTVYVVTTVGTWRAEVRRLVLTALGPLLLALAVLGHLLVLVLGAADALVMAAIGVPRLAWCARPIVEEARAQWREILGEDFS